MDKKLFVALEQLREIEKTYPISFYTYDERGIRGNAARLKQAFSWNKGYKEYFTTKVTLNPFLLNILKDMGCDTDCSSMTGLVMFRVCGFSGSGIAFSSSDTPPKGFAYVKKLGVIIDLDDVTHIQCLEETLGHIPETISCRFNPGGPFKISNDIMDNLGGSKYRVIIEQTGQAFRILEEKSAKHSGIHALPASSTVTNEYYPMLAKILFELAVKLREETGVHTASVDLLGGIGIPYRPDQEPNDILTIDDGMRGVYKEILTPAGMEDAALYTELGRFMMGPYGTLVTKAIHEKHTYKEYVGADACAVNLVRPAMYGAYHHITIMGREDKPCTRMYDVVGSLCKNSDKFAIDHTFPEVRKGGLLFIYNAGAHGFAMGYNYNGKLKSVEFLLKEDGTVEIIRRAEISEDYFTTLDFCNILKDIE